jgi:hypothetical protein
MTLVLQIFHNKLRVFLDIVITWQKVFDDKGGIKC